MATEGKPPQADKAEKGKEKLCQNKEAELFGRGMGDYGACMLHMHAGGSGTSAGNYHTHRSSKESMWIEQGHSRLEGACNPPWIAGREQQHLVLVEQSSCRVAMLGEGHISFCTLGKVQDLISNLSFFFSFCILLVAHLGK